MSEEPSPKKRKFTVADPSSSGRIKSFFITIIVIAVIVLAAVAVGVRTEFFKEWFVDYLEKQYGNEVDFTVGKISIGFPYNFVVKELQAKGSEPDSRVAFYVKRFESPLYAFRTKTYIFEKVDLSLQQNGEGVWSPGVVAKLGDLNQLESISVITRGIRDDLSIEIKNGSISWLGRDGQTERQADGIQFYMAPHDINGRDLTYYELKARLLSGSRSSGFVDEAWLATDEIDMITLFSGDGAPAPAANSEDASGAEE